MSVDFGDEKRLSAEDSHLHDYWHAVEALDAELERYMDAFSGGGG